MTIIPLVDKRLKERQTLVKWNGSNFIILYHIYIMQRFNVVFYRIELALALTEIYEGALKKIYI